MPVCQTSKIKVAQFPACSFLGYDTVPVVEDITALYANLLPLFTGYQ